MRALVLSGGGVKGAYQVGALKKWLLEDKVEYDAFCGVSVGALNSSFLAQFTDSQEAGKALVSLWSQVTDARIKRSWCPLGVVESLWKPSVFNSEPLQQWVRSTLNVDMVRISGKQLRVVACNWATGAVHVANEAAEDLASWVIASSSFPVMLLPVEIGGQLWTDGGLRNVTPLGEAIRLGADEIDVVMCSNPEVVEPFDAHKAAAVPGLLLQAIEIMSDAILAADLKVCGLKNDVAELRPEFRKVKIRLLQPQKVLTKDSLDFDPQSIGRMMAQGYEDACALG